MPPFLPILVFVAGAAVVLFLRKRAAAPVRQLPGPPVHVPVPAATPSVPLPVGSGVSPSSPGSEPTGGGTVSAPKHGAVGGFDPTAAAHLAPTLNVDLQDGRVRDGALLEAFQAASGLRVDGTYGPETKGALRYWLAVGGSQVSPPEAFTGSGEVKYSPPDGRPRLYADVPTHDTGDEHTHWPIVEGNCDHDAAKYYAPLVAKFMVMGKSYKKDADAMRALRSFQLASNIVVDGDYGRQSYHALVYWLRAANNPAKAPYPVFGGAATSYTPCKQVRLLRNA